MKSETFAPPEAPIASYEFGPVVIDVASRQILRNGNIVVIPSKAFDALTYLAARPDRTVSKEELISAIWKDMFVAEGSLVHSMSVLRRALGDDSTHPQLIITVPRQGYRLKGPVRASFETSGGDPAAAVEAAPVTRGSGVSFRLAAQHGPWKRVGLCTLLAVGLIFVVRAAIAPKPQPHGGAMLFTQGAPEGSTFVSGGMVSPDAHYIVFVARDREAALARLYLKQIDSVELRPLVGTEGASHPFWSPASDMIGFFANGELKTIDLRGNAPKAIASVAASVGGATWSSSGPILFSDWQTGMYRVDPAGGNPTRVITTNRPTADLVQKLPQFLPDGRHFLFFLHSADDEQTGSYVGSLDSPQRIRVLNQSSSPAIYSPSGYLLYVQDSVLMAQRFDASRLQARGKPLVVARGVSAPGDADGKMISASAKLLTFRSAGRTQELEWFERNGRRAGPILAGKALRSPMFSSDQNQMVAMDGGLGMWMVDLGRSAATRLEGDGIYPLWSPDRNRIAFESSNSLTVYVRNIGVSGQDEAIVSGNDRKILNDWSPVGNYLVYTTLDPNTKLDLVLLPMSGDRKPIRLLHTRFNESQGRISPDGHWIAYVCDESGAEEVYVQRFPSLGDKRIVSIGGGVEPMWRQDGRELFYLSPDYSIVSVRFEPAEPPVIGGPIPLFRAPINTSTTRNHYAAAPDGQKFLINVEDHSSYLSPVTVMVNWLDGLESNSRN